MTNDVFLPDDLLEQLKDQSKVADSPSLDIHGWIHTGSYALDRIISVKDGNIGIPTPCVVELAGPPSTAKTTLALEITREILENRNGLAWYGETEMRLRSDYAKTIIGLGYYDRMVQCQTRFCQDMFSKMELACRTIIKNNLSSLPSLYVVDSVGNLDDLDRYKGDDKDPTAKYYKHDFGVAKALKRSLGFVWTVLSKTNSVLLLINHQHEEIDMTGWRSAFAAKKKTPGGVYKDYMAGVRLTIGVKSYIKKGSKKIGAVVKVKNTKSSVDMPFGECEFEVTFGKGIEKEKDIYDTAKSLDLIYKEKGRFYFDGTEIGSREKAVELLKTDHALRDDLIEAIKEEPADWELDDD